jgi:hypothetical protein
MLFSGVTRECTHESCTGEDPEYGCIAVAMSLQREAHMPQRMWKHTCLRDGQTCWHGSPISCNCGAPVEFSGWHYGMIESMARYQTRYGLQPIGEHRQMADDLFRKVVIGCPYCNGQGLRTLEGGERWEACSLCRGLGIFFVGPLTEIIDIYRRVLEAFPDAAGDPCPNFAPRRSLITSLRGW